jgi:HEAT repeat protein
VPLWLTQRRLNSGKATTRRKALERLCQRPRPKALGALKLALQDQDAEVRRLAATALGKLEIEERIDPLLHALGDSDSEVQKAAILSLKRSSSEHTAEALVPLLRNEDAAVRGHALQVLTLLGWRPANREDEMWYWAAKGQFSRVAAFGAVAIPVLEAVVRSGPYSLAVAAAQGLGEIGTAAVVRPLLAALKSNEAAVCAAAIEALGNVGGAEVGRAIIGMLRHQNGQVRMTAADALGRLRPEGTVEAVTPLLKDSVWEVRKVAAEALGRLKDARAVEPLAQTLGDTDADVRETTAVSLGRIGDRRAIGPLVMSLKDCASGVRRIAAAALSRIDEEWTNTSEARAAFEDLKSALEHEDSDVRHFVGSLLAGIGAAPPESALTQPGAESSTGAVESRRKLGISLLLALLCDVDRDLRQAAAEALGRLKDPRAESGLARAIGDADAGVRRAAEQSLKSITQLRA